MKYCLIGDKLSHSYSSVIHKISGLDYSLVELSKDGLQSFLLANNYNGFNITIPYKETVLPLLDNLSNEATKIGAVNTVLVKDGKTFGYNTDVYGLQALLKKNKISLKNKNIAIMGSGGASKTALYVAREQKCKNVSVISRSGEINYQNCYEKLNNIDILINATPVGMEGREQKDIIDISKFRKVRVVIDLIYNPNRTNLLQKAQKQRIKYVNGLDMLIFQAQKAQEIWGIKSGFSFSETKKHILSSKLNIVLSGMPSSGKSSIGKMLSQKLNKAFFDVDEEFLVLTNTYPSEYIQLNGEEKFRIIENQIIEKLSKKKGVVISLGGGSIIHEDNERLLKQNGIVFYLDRRRDKLEDDNRPISQKIGIKELYKKRKARYLESLDYLVKNNGKKEKTVEEIIKRYENTCS